MISLPHDFEHIMLGQIHRLKAIKICDELTAMPEFEDQTLDLPID